MEIRVSSRRIFREDNTTNGENIENSGFTGSIDCK